MKERFLVFDPLRSPLRRQLQLREPNPAVVKAASPHIARELAKKTVVVGLERLTKSLFLFPALLQQNEEAPELRAPPRLSAHQVVHERPRLRVEKMPARFLVVLRRVVPNREELFQREQDLAAEAQDVALDRKADARLRFGREEGAVEIRNALPSPGRLRRKAP